MTQQKITVSQLESFLFNDAEILRGNTGHSEYRGYVFSLLIGNQASLWQIPSEGRHAHSGVSGFPGTTKRERKRNRKQHGIFVIRGQRERVIEKI